MNAISNSEQNVLQRIDLMNKKVESVSGEPHKKIDNLSTELRENIALVHTHQTTSISGIHDRLTVQGARLDDLEQAANTYLDKWPNLRGKSRQRAWNHNNAEITAGYSGSMRGFVTTGYWRTHYNWTTFPLWTGHTGAYDGDPPRPIMVKFHYFRRRQTFSEKQPKPVPIIHNSRRMHIYPDYTAKVAKQRATFN